MKHLSIDEIIDFVSINKLDIESLKLASDVNAHILRCNACRKKVEAFQNVYDELTQMGKKEYFIQMLNKRISDDQMNVEKQIDNFK